MHHLRGGPRGKQVGFNHIAAIEFFGPGQGGFIEAQDRFAALGLKIDPAVDLEFGGPLLHRSERRVVIYHNFRIVPRRKTLSRKECILAFNRLTTG
jgi:hypothetical protein